MTRAVGAGIMVIALAATAAGVYQISKHQPQPAETRAAEGPKPTAAPSAAALEADREARRIIAERNRQLDGKVKCIDGVLFAIEQDAWTNVGTC